MLSPARPILFSPYGLRDLVIYGVVPLVLGLGCGALALVAGLPWWYLPAALLSGAGVFAASFFRCPRRHIPAEARVMVAPADGVVRDVETVREEDHLGCEAIRIGIFMSIFDVHTNRAPAGGRVSLRLHREGVYRDARDPRAVQENESLLLGLDPAGDAPVPFAVRQVAGAVARRIVTPVVEGDELERGQLFGMIKFGSRAEVYVPADSGFVPAVAPGDVVRGGTSILGRFGEAGA